MSRLTVIKYLSQAIADICDQPKVTTKDWAKILTLQGYIEHQVHLFKSEEEAAWEAAEGARIQAECDRGFQVLRYEADLHRLAIEVGEKRRAS